MTVQQKIEPATLASAMAAAFGEIEAATKSANNPHFKSKYADLTGVIEAIKPALVNHGLFFTQHPRASENGITIETFLHHAGGESMALGALFVPANKQDAQGFGSALTYARRYALVTAFGVPVEDDDGNAASRVSGRDKAESQMSPPGAAITDEQWAKIVALCQATGTKGDEVKGRIGAENLKVLTDVQYVNALNYLEAKLADAAKAETDAKAKEVA